MGKILYLLFIQLYLLAIKIVSPFNPKAKLWLKGRQNVFKRMQELNISAYPVIWFHCASLGEFEQGRPVIEKIRTTFPAYKILLTFFSPSGYEVQKNYAGADFVFYLPMDSDHNARMFLSIARPKLILFIKYEFWHFYLHEASKQQIPLLLVSAIFRKSQPFFQWYGGFHRQMLRNFTHFFVQNENSMALLNSIGIYKNVTSTGDTRFDRVVTIAEQFEPIEVIDKFCNNQPVLVAGSTWLEDDEELDHFVNTHPDYRFIIAPHDVHADRLKECLQLYKHSILFSQYDPALHTSHNALIIDNIGMLSRLYNYATVCFVGGGFGADGVHNVLEAAVYRKPVIFGPQYEKFIEATELEATGGAISIENALELEKELENLFARPAYYNKAAYAAAKYVYGKTGATFKVVSFIQENRLLTN